MQKVRVRGTFGPGVRVILERGFKLDVMPELQRQAARGALLGAVADLNGCGGCQHIFLFFPQV
jgi:hypothetical protein